MSARGAALDVSSRVISEPRSLFATRSPAIDRLLDLFQSKKAEILDILTDTTTFRAAKAELFAAEKALLGASDEIRHYRPQELQHLAAFMPSNILLYSYVLYAVIPSLYIKRISIRPATCVHEQAQRLHDLLNPTHELEIEVINCEQKIFVNDVTTSADVVVFTGTFGNSEKVRKGLSKEALFVFFGQGVNPFIVGPSADLGKAARDLVAVRLFNSGQDCMGPDAIFVSEQIIEAFLHQLRARLDMVEFGPRKEPTADYGPLYYHPAISGITNYFLDNESRIVYGGKVDYSKRHVEPAIIRSSIHDRADIIEFFGPVFNLITYDTVEALTHELSKDFYTERALGASIYGVPKLEAFLRKRHMVSVDCTLFDLEDGNTPFGGYGRMANYAWCKGDLRIEPILLSRMVADMKGRQR